MNLRTIISTFIAMCILKSCYSFDYKGARIVTYGEPCVTTRSLPFEIEGPRPLPKEEKIPLSMNFKIVSDMYVQPRRVEYPIAIEMPHSATSQSEEVTMKDDTLRGKVYAYNTYVPPATVDHPLPSKMYNYAVDVPVRIQEITYGSERQQVQRLKGLKSRIDRILVPACEVASESSPCQCQYS
ncbi:hypothetical protein ANTPLA_LOCUS10364 [Anthophora plagiata]